jgi:hypothetical protein
METKEITLKSGKQVIVTITEELGGIVRVDANIELMREESNEIAEHI